MGCINTGGDVKCYFKKEVNYPSLQRFGAEVVDLQNRGKEVTFSFHYNIRARVNENDLVGLMRQDNPELDIHYSNDTLERTDLIKETDKPLWDFSISEDGTKLKIVRA